MDLAAYVLNVDGSLQTINVLFPASSFPQTISNPTAALSLTHQQYLVVFGYGNVNNAVIDSFFFRLNLMILKGANFSFCDSFISSSIDRILVCQF